MKLKHERIGLWVGLFLSNLTAIAAIPVAPTLVPVPAPTAAQMQSTAQFTPAPMILTPDQQAALSAAKAWVIAVGPPQALSTANPQVNALIAQGFVAFLEPISTNQAQVLIGPEVDMTHLKQTEQALITQFPVLSIRIISYNISS